MIKIKRKYAAVGFFIFGLILVDPLLMKVSSFLVCVLRILGAILLFVLSACFWRSKEGEEVNLIRAIPVEIGKVWIWCGKKYNEPPFKTTLKILEIATFIIVALGFWFDFEQGKLVETQIFASNGISISRLAEQSQWRDEVGNPTMGDRSSYIILASLQNDDNLGKPELKAVAELQIKRVKDLYKNDLLNPIVQDFRAICKKPYSKCPYPEQREPFEGFDADNVFRCLRDEKLWTERARAAFMLRNIEKASTNEHVTPEGLYKKLIDHMREKNEPSLLVSKMAFDTYRLLVGDEEKNVDVFDFERAIKVWEDPRSRTKMIKKIELKFPLKKGP